MKFLKSFCLAVFAFLAAATHAQTEAEVHRTVIDAFYPAMVQMVNDGKFDKARILCRQAIAWEPNNAMHHYNLGCIESKSGDLDKAFAALNQAVSLGYADLVSLRADPDLMAVRYDERFPNLLLAIAQNAVKQPSVATAPPPATPVQSSPPVNAPVAPSSEAAPVAAKLVQGRPEGLFFMTRFWSFTGTLEKAAWYFSPNGQVYQNLEEGFSPEDLAAHKGRKGSFKLEGKNLEVTWSDGKTTKSPLDPDTNGPGFMWDGGIFTVVKPFGDPNSIVGKYEGGEALARGGNFAAFSKTLDLRADGTFSRDSVGSVSSTGSSTKVGAGSVGNDAGTWKLSPYSLTLTGNDGRVTRKIAFPYDDEKTPVYPDRFFFGGMMFKRQ